MFYFYTFLQLEVYVSIIISLRYNHHNLYFESPGVDASLCPQLWARKLLKQIRVTYRVSQNVSNACWICLPTWRENFVATTITNKRLIKQCQNDVSEFEIFKWTIHISFYKQLTMIFDKLLVNMSGEEWDRELWNIACYSLTKICQYSSYFCI